MRSGRKSRMLGPTLCLAVWLLTAICPSLAQSGCHNIGNELICFGSHGPTATISTVYGGAASSTVTSILTIPDAEGSIVLETARPKATTKLEKSGHSHGDKKKDQNVRTQKKPTTCKSKKGETWNLKLRVASIFVIFATSTLGVLIPLFLSKYTRLSREGFVFTFIKQFGTGVIISTVYIHLLDHSIMQFDNPCLGGLEYEPTPFAVTMAGAFLSFLVDYSGIRILAHQTAQRQRAREEMSGANQTQQDAISPISSDGKDAFEQYDAARANDLKRNQAEEQKLGVFIMEGGIIFHSIMVGVLLTITPDSELVILFAVILVHQLFEGLALGARIEPMEKIRDSTKVMMGVAFSVTCPIGMGIGIGVRKSFNGNDRNTILVLGIMNALSAGVLAWVAFVELWSKDWMHGELRTANAKKTTIAMVSLISGIVLMGVLGAWA